MQQHRNDFHCRRKYTKHNHYRICTIKLRRGMWCQTAVGVVMTRDLISYFSLKHLRANKKQWNKLKYFSIWPFLAVPLFTLSRNLLWRCSPVMDTINLIHSRFQCIYPDWTAFFTSSPFNYIILMNQFDLVISRELILSQFISMSSSALMWFSDVLISGADDQWGVICLTRCWPLNASAAGSEAGNEALREEERRRDQFIY